MKKQVLACGILLQLLISGCSGTQAQPQFQATAVPPAHPSPFSGDIELVLASQSKGDSTSDWDRKFWITKAARALHGGQGITSVSELNALAAMSDDQVLAELSKDPRLSDTLLDFNLYYLGEKQASLRDSTGALLQYVYNFPSALGGARGVSTGAADFRSLWQNRQPYYLPPLLATQDGATPPAGTDPAQYYAERRKLIYADAQATVDTLVADIQDPAHFDSKQFCADFAKLQANKRPDGTFTGLFVSGIPTSLLTQALLSPGFWEPEFVYCQIGGAPPTLAQVKALKPIQQKFFDALTPFEGKVYHVATIDDLQPLDVASLGIEESTFNLTMAGTLVNSSTNMDRKRASFVLKRFFCDDLTPLNVEAPSVHGGGVHGSDPSCFACHYKLDPLAGFFRDRGIVFFDFAGAPSIIFDDQATASLPAYEENWKAAPGAVSGTGKPLEWNIGYIRSVNDPTKNFYGEDPGNGLDVDGLFRIIQQAPEARSCVVRRVYEYFVGESQAVDGEYLNGLVTQFNKTLGDTPKSAMDALMGVVKASVGSQAFHQRNPSVDTCYDHVAGYDPSTALPCKVAFIVKNNCVRCHSAPESGTPGDGLYLNKWITLQDGRTTFLHIDGGKQAEPETTFTDITAHLTASDPKIRMPKDTFMENQDRLDLFTWADGMAQKYAKPAPAKNQARSQR